MDWDEYYEYFLMDRFSLKSEQVMKINLTAASREIKVVFVLIRGVKKFKFYKSKKSNFKLSKRIQAQIFVSAILKFDFLLL